MKFIYDINMFHIWPLKIESFFYRITESIIDALTLYDQGFTNVIPAYGVNGLDLSQTLPKNLISDDSPGFKDFWPF